VVADVARAWENRFAALAGALPGVTPAPRVWTGIAKRLGLASTARGTPAWWEGLVFWRGFALASFTAALALSVMTVMGPPAVPTLAVSVEPAGGSPTGQPTGPVIYTGRVERFY